MFVLKLKHWQIFIVMIIAFTLMNTSVEGDSMVSGILVTIGGLIWFGWMLLTGNSLFQLLPARIKMNHALYLINSFLWLSTYVIIMILSNGEGMTFDGLVAIPFFYIVFAFLHFFAFPAKVLVSLEKDGVASFGEYFGTALLIFFLPIGIWFVQPRINKVADKSASDSETLST